MEVLREHIHAAVENAYLRGVNDGYESALKKVIEEIEKAYSGNGSMNDGLDIALKIVERLDGEK